MCAHSGAWQLAPEVGAREQQGQQWGRYKKAACIRRQCLSWSWEQGCFRVLMGLQEVDVTATCPEEVTDVRDKGHLLL